MVVVRVAAPALTFPDLFEAVRRVYKTTGVNQFAFAVPEGDDAEEFYFAAGWAASRAGWREGYSLQGPSQLAFPGVRRKPYESEFEAVARIVDVSAGMTADDIAGVMGLP